MSDYQRSFYDRHYAERASLVAEQVAHPMFADFYDRLSGRVLDLGTRGGGGGGTPGGGPAGRAGAVRLLELGCGEGLLAASLHRVAAERGMEVSYTGSDLSPAALELVGSAVPGRFVAGDATAVANGLAAASQDMVVVKNLLHHLARPAELLGAAGRALAPGGRLVAVEASRGSPQFWAVSLLAPRRERWFFVSGPARNRRAFAEAGLQLVAVERFSFLPYELAFAIRFDWFRRRRWLQGPAAVGRVAGADQWLADRLPALASYVVYVAEPDAAAADGTAPARGTSRA